MSLGEKKGVFGENFTGGTGRVTPCDTQKTPSKDEWPAWTVLSHMSFNSVTFYSSTTSWQSEPKFVVCSPTVVPGGGAARVPCGGVTNSHRPM